MSFLIDLQEEIKHYEDMYSNEPLCINSSEDQNKIKAFLYYTLEEIYEFRTAESIESLIDEIADVLNFFSSLIISLEYDLEDIYNDCYKGKDLEDIIMKILSIGHTLKNRGWKSTNYLTDEVEFKHRLTIAYSMTIDFFLRVASEEAILVSVKNKLNVNKTRKETNY